MNSKNLPFNSVIHESIVHTLIDLNENEHAYMVFQDIQKRGCIISPHIIHKVVVSLTSDNEVDLAYKLILDSEILETASRNANPSLAADALRILDQKGFLMRDFYLEPLLESFIRTNDIDRILETLHLMRLSDMGKGKTTLTLLSAELSKDINSPSFSPQIFFDSMVKFREVYPLTVDTITLNSLLKAYIISGEIPVAINKMDSWFSQLEIKKNSDTYSMLLSGCVTKKNTYAAKQIFDYMVNPKDNQEKIKPNQEAYESMILVSLTQSKYENAFVYLEAMKANGFIPSRHVYSSLVKKCEIHGDHRQEAVINEMKLFGYPIMFGVNLRNGTEYKIPTDRIL
ncbi:Protein Rf1, mitochondrial [Smittium mucronatum]|uniref:Protein Rf1, mitochondrial n=1 Tax=Smittium mucronatum TaxID=133383 RepID=A0A1R0H7C5_9FUNG|nr:Protein Rf1, mitochondrial [Smittium mucronatum]